MATFHDRTIAPRVQRGLLRAGRAACRVLTTSDALTTIEAEFAGLIAQPWPDEVSAQSEPKLDVPNQPENFGLDADCPGATGVVLPFIPTTFALPETGDLKSARALQMRRELRKGLDYGLALMDAQARARIAAYDAGHAKSVTVADLASLPSLTSAFATRRDIFGAFDGGIDHG